MFTQFADFLPLLFAEGMKWSSPKVLAELLGGGRVGEGRKRKVQCRFKTVPYSLH